MEVGMINCGRGIFVAAAYSVSPKNMRLTGSLEEVGRPCDDANARVTVPPRRMYAMELDASRVPSSRPVRPSALPKTPRSVNNGAWDPCGSALTLTVKCYRDREYPS